MPKYHILNVNKFKELENQTVNVDLDALIEYNKYASKLFEKLCFIERNQFFAIIKEFLNNHEEFYKFLDEYGKFENKITKTQSALMSEFYLLKDFQLLEIGELDLKIDSNPAEFNTLLDLVGKIDAKQRDGEFISDEEVLEFYQSMRELFEAVQKF